MRMDEILKAVTGELDRRGVPWELEARGKHRAVKFLGHTQFITGSRPGAGAIDNARAHTRRIIRQKGRS